MHDACTARDGRIDSNMCGQVVRCRLSSHDRAPTGSSHDDWSSWFARERVMTLRGGYLVRDREVDTQRMRHRKAAQRQLPTVCRTRARALVPLSGGIRRSGPLQRLSAAEHGCCRRLDDSLVRDRAR